MFFRSKRFLRVSLYIFVLVVITFSMFSYFMESEDNKSSTDVLIFQGQSNAHEIVQNQVVDYKNFSLRINNTACSTFDRELLGVIIITSYVGHDELRSAHRQAISQKKLRDMGMVRIFLLAEISSREKFINQKQIENENNRFHDLLQGNFVEAYRNLTYKHLMGLQWVAMNCQKAKFVIKADDDIVFDIFHLKNYLEGMEIQGNIKNFIAGYVFANKKPIRIKANKWYVSFLEFDRSVYPDYASGWLYLTNPSTAAQLVVKSQTEKFFWIDDTYVTGILRAKLNIPVVRLNNWFSANSQFLDCCIEDLRENSYECEYFIGPNGGDNKLITEFLHEVEKCYFDECTKRNKESSLKKTCVAKVKDIIQDHGDAVIKSVRLR